MAAAKSQLKFRSSATKLLKWFDEFGRHDLPWQKNVTAYRVWVSEIMLQQTQVTTVIPYFTRFMQSFPNVKKLAAADENAVLSHWTGLGYYARARNLHKTAKLIVNDHRSSFPQSVEELEGLPGIGRSTAGAILSLALKKRAPILDGNVKRVFTRVLALNEWPGSKTAHGKLWRLAEELLPQERVNDYNQALMDLGATLCTRSKPNCEKCPWQSFCAAYAEGNPSKYPVKKPSKTKPHKSTFMLLLKNSRGEILLEKRPASGIWGGLWSFPQISDETEIEKICRAQFACKISQIKKGRPLKHVFSHYTLNIQPIEARASLLKNICLEAPQQIWYNSSQALPGGLAAPVLKLLQEYL